MIDYMFLIALVLLFFGVLGARKSQNPENKEVVQQPRWMFFIGALLAVASLSTAFANALVIAFGAQSGFWGDAFPLILGTATVAQFFGATNKAFLIKPQGNQAYLADDKFFGMVGDKGLRIYRIFFGGLKCKYPWEIVEVVMNFSRDLQIDFEFVAEFSDATGIVRGVATVQPDSKRPQQFISTGTNEEQVNMILSKVLSAKIKEILGGELRAQTVEWGMTNRKKLREMIETGDGREEIKKFEDSYGVKTNSFAVSDIDFTDEVKNAFEQVKVNERLRQVQAAYLKQLGYSDAQIKGEDKEHPVSFEHTKWALDMAKETAGEIKRNIKDIRGLEGLKSLVNIGGK